MTLRAKLIEAGARANHEAQREHFRPDWPLFDDLGHFGQRSAREFMAITLDAMLDCLAENEREWIAEERQSKANAWSGATIEDVKPIANVFVVRGLLAVLKATPTEEE